MPSTNSTCRGHQAELLIDCLPGVVGVASSTVHRKVKRDGTKWFDIVLWQVWFPQPTLRPAFSLLRPGASSSTTTLPAVDDRIPDPKEAASKKPGKKARTETQ